MTKELIDRVWNHCLPKEFKEEVKNVFFNCNNSEMKAYLIHWFGYHNLTSDAEGEEMLMVPRSAVIAEMDKLHKYSYQMPDLQLGLNALTALFGSKCLPDNVDSLVSNVDSLEPKSAEPKFKVGDKVRYKEFVGTVYQIEETDYVIRNLAGGDLIGWLKESDLEPYTEPKESNCTIKSDTCQPVTDCHHIEENREMPNRDLCDKLIRRGFENHNRMHIAAMAMQGLLANTALYEHKVKEWLMCKSNDNPIRFIPMLALKYADALISESNKQLNIAMEQEE